MTLAEEMAAEARAAVEAMKAAAAAARRLHARAELLRHMMTTAARQTGPAGEAVAAIAGEWMKAWALTGYPALRSEMEAFTAACLESARAPGPEADARLRGALSALDAALETAGATLADEMAWRSECAHGWWALVSPAPSGRGYREERASARPFWTAGAPPHCGAEP
ncbi:MAG: hypothetical protein ACE37J_20765 [Pikeienuella sp.]|uniref:hypothetical protein n=1 Tax=Pikeienuella sp. TaxID=2831957 RepID=UPI0039191BB7